jgi:hypothetical protein
MQDEIWKNRLSDDDVKLLQDVEVMSGNLISQVYIFIDLFHQYIDLVQSAAIFSPDFVEPEENDANVYPTQTSSHLESAHDPAMSGNRAERRAQEKPKKKTPFDVVQGKK